MKKFAVSLVFLSLVACGQKDVSFETLEQARKTANDNALWNAQVFRQNNVLISGWSVIPNGDSSQLPNCPQGDGWATLEVVSPDKTKRVKIKCSTVSGAIGCLFSEDFTTKPYASDDAHCQPVSKVPFPLPKISQ